MKAIKVLLSWSSLITSFHLMTAAVISPGYTTPPLSLQPLKGAVSASHHDCMTKFGAAGYVPSAKYSQYLPQRDRLPNKLNTLLLTVLFAVSVIIQSDFTLYLFVLTHRCRWRNLFCTLCYLLIKENPSPGSIYKKGDLSTAFWRLMRNKMNSNRHSAPHKQVESTKVRKTLVIFSIYLLNPSFSSALGYVLQINKFKSRLFYFGLSSKPWKAEMLT